MTPYPVPVLGRRAFLGGCACLACAPAAALPVAPASMTSLIDPGYKPVDRDERGVWHEMEKAEDELTSSNLAIRDPALNSYVTDLMGKLAPEHAKDMRIVVMRTPAFNAAMAPTGLMLVNSGLLLRMRGEAQFGGVLGHETGHYLRKHSIERFRRISRTAAIANWLSIGGALIPGLGFGATALLFGLVAYGREQERQADAYGLRLIENAGYEPRAMSGVWQQIVEERDASAQARGRKKRRPDPMLASHPADAERMVDLRASAQTTVRPGVAYDEGRDRYRAAIDAHLLTFLDDQVKMNDAGSSLYLINALAENGWTGPLRFHEGEVYRLRGDPGDGPRAETAYAASVTMPDAPAPAHRSYGYALLKAGKGEAGKAQLTQYLAKAPAATDRAMIEHTLRQ